MNDRVDDAELLYHRAADGHFWRDESGGLHCSDTAFQDKEKQPSVDRASLQNSEPARSRNASSDAIFALSTGRVRDIEVAQNDDRGRLQFMYEVDVLADPIAEGNVDGL